MKRLRELFQHKEKDNVKYPLMLGFAGGTGSQITDAMFGGGFMRKSFFNRCKGKIDDLGAVRDAWLDTAIAGYGGGNLERIFRAVDPDGQTWKIENKKKEKM